MSIEAPQVGQRVAYEDMANPRRVGTITDREDELGWRVVWDDKADDECEGETWSDLRQHGWREVTS